GELEPLRLRVEQGKKLLRGELGPQNVDCSADRRLFRELGAYVVDVFGVSHPLIALLANGLLGQLAEQRVDEGTPRHVVRQRRASVGIAAPASLASRLSPSLRSEPMDLAVDLDLHGGRRRHTLQGGN